MKNSDSELIPLGRMAAPSRTLSAEARKGTLIVCTKDRPGELRETLESIIFTCLEPPSLIVVVDSSDSLETQQMVTQLAFGTKGNIVYLKSKPGLPHQRNVGAYFVLKNFPSRSKYLFFLDDDVTPSRNYFTNARGLFETMPDVGVLGGRDISLIPKAGSTILALLGFRRDAPNNISIGGFGSPVWNQAKLVDVLWVPGGMQTIRGELLLLEAFNGRIRMYGEDVDMHLRLGRHTRIVSTSCLQVLHRSADSGKDSPSELFAYEDAFRWRLGKQYRRLVSPLMVIVTTLVLAGISLALGLFSRAKRAEFKGHVMFLIGLIRGSSVEQYVTHDDWYTEPPEFEFWSDSQQSFNK